MIKPLNLNILPNNNVYQAKNGTICFSANRQLPNQLYHITSEENWKNIQKAGKLIPYEDELSDLCGVFTFDMKDFLQNWISVKPINFAYNLLNTIRRKCIGNNFVLLKINLNNSILPDIKVRKLSEVFKEDSKALKGLQIYEAINNPKYKKQVEYLITNEIPIQNIEYINKEPERNFNDLIRENMKYDDDLFTHNVVISFMSQLIGKK